MNNLKFIVLSLSTLMISNAFAIPKIDTIYGKNEEGFARVKIINETTKLPIRAHSKWYKATDRRFNHTDFSIWCDYIELHPEYEQYIYE